MVTPAGKTEKSTKFDELYSESSPPASNTRAKRTKRGGWSRSQTSTVAEKKTQAAAKAVNAHQEPKVEAAPPKKQVEAKEAPTSSEDKKTQAVSTPLLGDSSLDSSEDALSTRSFQLFAKIADIIETRLPQDQDEEADRILSLPEDQILSWFATVIGAPKEGESAPGIDPKVHEKQQERIEELQSEVSKQSTAVSQLKEVVKLREQENKKLLHQANQAKLQIMTLSDNVGKLSPSDDSKVGDQITVEYIHKTTEDISRDVQGLKALFGLSSVEEAASESEVKAASSGKAAESDNIPSQKDVNKLFKQVSVLSRDCLVEVQKVEDPDKRPPEAIQQSFFEILKKAQGYANRCLELKAELVKDIDRIQTLITEKTVPHYDQEHMNGVEIVSQFYSEKQFAEDLQRHHAAHNQMRIDLKNVISKYGDICEQLATIAHNISVVLMNCEEEAYYNTSMEIQSTLNKLPIDIQSIVVPEVKENLINSAFKKVYQSIVTFQAMCRNKRKVLMDYTIPNGEAEKAAYLKNLQVLSSQQKLHLQELEKTWKKIAPHVEKRKEELTARVAEGNQNVELGEPVLKTVAHYDSTTPEIYVQEKVQPYKEEHAKNAAALHQLEADLNKFYEIAELAKKEGDRTFSATTLEGYWVPDYRWTAGGYYDNEIKALFKADSSDTGWGISLW